MEKWLKYLLIAGALFVIYEQYEILKKSKTKIKIKE